MANASQTYSTETSIQNDFKIFLGKKSEIVEILATGKVVDRKWYLAWDTGEIFIGNKLHKLMRFGGSNETLTTDTVKGLIESETHGNFNEIRRQVAKVLQDYNKLSAEQQQLAFEFSSSIASMTTDIRNTIQNQITAVLSDYSNITYSKTDIDAKLNMAVNNVKNFIQNNYVSNEYLTNNLYATQSYVDTKVSGSLIYESGNKIKANKDSRVNGLFFSTSKSDDGSVEKAHIYYLINGNMEDMTPAGSGGGGSYVAPTLKLMFSDTIAGETRQVTKKLLELGASFDGTRVFTWSCTSPTQISGSLSFTVPNSNVPDNLYREIKSNINPLATNKTLTLSTDIDGGLNNPAPGEYLYSINGVDKQGNVIKGSFTLQVVGPIYFGEYTSQTPNAIKIQSYTKVLKESAAGEYTIQIVTSGRYAWFCVPESMTINGFALSGFKAPFEEPSIQILTFGSQTARYKCYRSTESLQAGNVTITVV